MIQQLILFHKLIQKQQFQRLSLQIFKLEHKNEGQLLSISEISEIKLMLLAFTKLALKENVLFTSYKFDHRRIMLRYSNQSRATEATNQLTLSQGYSSNELRPHQTFASKPTPLFIPQRNQKENTQTNTPRTSRPMANSFIKQLSSYSKSINVTPQKEKKRLEGSFVRKEPMMELLDLTASTRNVNNISNLQEIKTDRSQRILKGKPAALNEDMEKKLRQTVTNMTAWKLRDSGSIRTDNYELKTGAKTSRESYKIEPIPFRCRQEEKFLNQSEIDHKKEIKSKFSTKTHSRNNSNCQQPSKIQMLVLKTVVSQENNKLQKKQSELSSKTDRSYTPRSSQDPLTLSMHRKDKIIGQVESKNDSVQLNTPKKKISYLLKPKQFYEPKLEDFDLGACKGEGRFGKVFPAIHRKTGFLFGIKQIKKESVRFILDQFILELKISLFISHSNIVKTYGYFQDKEHFYIILEYMEQGSLYKPIKSNKRLRQQDVKGKLVDICQAVLYLHSRDILHRDIKPENIVLSNGVCKLCDFGWAVYSKERRTTYCGTLDYVCPEILEGESYDNFVDIWAIGVLAFEMLTGKAPFYHISRQQTMKSILKCNVVFPSDMSVQAKLFITKALQKSPDQRFTIESLINDKFLYQQQPFLN